MCIRDRPYGAFVKFFGQSGLLHVSEVDHKRIEDVSTVLKVCLLYTSDAADERSSVDLGGRRIIKKKNNVDEHEESVSSPKKKETSQNKYNI